MSLRERSVVFLWRFFFCCMTLVGLGRLFIVGVYRVFLQS